MTGQATPGSTPSQEFERVLTSADKQVASFTPERQTALERVQHLFHSFPTLVPLIVLLVGILGFSLFVDRFLTVGNFAVALQQITVVGIIGVAQTLIIITAGVDLSVGAIMVLSSVAMGSLAVNYGLPGPIAFVGGLLVGGICGWINGTLVARFRLPPFIVTLGTFSIFFATNLLYTRSQQIAPRTLDDQAPFLRILGATVGDTRITIGIIAMLILVAAFWYVLTQTAWGRHVYAIGDDPAAARLSGIDLSRTLVSVYTVAGVICALGAWASIARNGVSPQLGQDTNLQTITAVVIGGTSLFGGRGSVIGTLIGAMIVGVFTSGLKLAGVDPQWTTFSVGMLVILAVAADQWIRKVSA